MRFSDGGEGLVASGDGHRGIVGGMGLSRREKVMVDLQKVLLGDEQGDG